MKAFLVGFAVMTGPALAWHMFVVARRWDDDDHKHPSGPVTPAVAAAGARPGPDGSQPHQREDRS